MRVAVTGAGGLLGAALVSRLRAAGQQVIALSSTLSEAVPGVKRLDVRQSWQEIADTLCSVDVVVHAAAHIPRNQRDPEEARACVEVNALGTLNVVRASAAARVAHFIFISGANVLKPQSRPVREADPIGCNHAPYYLGSKVLAEIFVDSFDNNAMKTLILRPSSMYGPHMKSGAFSVFAGRLRAKLPVVLQNGGTYRADFIWRDDVANIVAKAIDSGREGVVNLGSGQTHSLLEVAYMMGEILHVPAELIHVEPAQENQEFLGFSAVDISRAREWFDYHPTPLRLGLQTWLTQG